MIDLFLSECLQLDVMLLFWCYVNLEVCFGGLCVCWLFVGCLLVCRLILRLLLVLLGCYGRRFAEFGYVYYYYSTRVFLRKDLVVLSCLGYYILILDLLLWFVLLYLLYTWACVFLMVVFIVCLINGWLRLLFNVGFTLFGFLYCCLVI